ncbi:hypothetical protein Tco_0697824 [Tanacetum coccineum]
MESKKWLRHNHNWCYDVTKPGTVLGDVPHRPILSCIGTLGVRIAFSLVCGCELLEVLSFGYLPPSSTKVARAAWLATLEPDIADYSSATIKFYLDEKFITVTGDKCLSPSQAQFHHFKRLSATDAIAEAYAIHCFSMDTISDATLQLPDTVLNDLANVLQGFTSVFTVLTGLPPSHTQNKSIVLHEGVNAVKVHPYRYPVSQKTQIEIIVAGMLQEVTIKDSFPMPTVEELLDELHGAHFFSKLDLYSEHRLYAKLSKCAFYQQRIEYLGHIVMGVGVEMDPAKVTAVPNWPIPVHIATPCFPWSYSPSTCVVVLPDFIKPFIVKTDASGHGAKPGIRVREGRK